jgi:addiction module RelB/DinJ family antitoxin
MAANSVARARIDERIQREAAAVLQAMGLTVSETFRLMMVRIAREKALPFEPLIRNSLKPSTCWRRTTSLPHIYFHDPLAGEWSDHRDCHIRPDSILIYRKPDAQTLELVRLGSHSELGF